MKYLNKTRKRIELFGVQIDPFSMEETLKHVNEIIENCIITQHVVVNVAKLIMMQRDKNLKEVVNSCDVINADGKGIVWGARLLGLNIPERVAGIDLMLNVIKLADKKKYKVYFLGAKYFIINKAIEQIKSQYPNLQIVGYRDGYFSESEEEKVTKGIKDSEADILFVGMSSPRKELFLKKYINYMQIPFVMGVGGSFDVIAGYIKRAPIWMQKIGSEWLYRLVSEPKRMWKRYLITNTLFLWMILKALLLKRKYE